MARTPFKMNGFGGFGNSPMKQEGIKNVFRDVKKGIGSAKSYPFEKFTSTSAASKAFNIGRTLGTGARAIPGLSTLAGSYGVLKEGVKRVAKGIKTGVPQTKLTGKNIKDTFKRVPKKKYI